jgi:hypothetical protein
VLYVIITIAIIAVLYFLLVGPKPCPFCGSPKTIRTNPCDINAASYCNDCHKMF